MSKNLSKQEFVVLMLMHGAHADFHFSDSEKQLLKETFGADPIYTAEELYAKFNDWEMDLLFIKYYERYLNTKVKQEAFFSTLKNLFHSDGVYCRFEQFFDSYFKRIVAFT